MATESAGGLTGHARSVTVTTLACLAGIAAAVGAFFLAGPPTDAETARAAATNSRALYMVLGAILLQFPILHVVGVKFDDLSVKDYLYVAFMTFALWFISFGIMLTAVGL